MYDGFAYLQLERPLRDNLLGHTSITLSGDLHAMRWADKNQSPGHGGFPTRMPLGMHLGVLGSD